MATGTIVAHENNTVGWTSGKASGL